MTTRVTVPADVHQIDATGFVWTFLDEAEEPSAVVVDAVIVAGDGDDPFLARVVDIVAGASGRRIVHLEVVGVRDPVVDQLRDAYLPSASTDQEGTQRHPAMGLEVGSSEWLAEMERRARAVSSGAIRCEPWDHAKARLLQRFPSK
jgi:hypothetical protein